MLAAIVFWALAALKGLVFLLLVGMAFGMAFACMVGAGLIAFVVVDALRRRSTRTRMKSQF